MKFRDACYRCCCFAALSRRAVTLNSWRFEWKRNAAINSTRVWIFLRDSLEIFVKKKVESLYQWKCTARRKKKEKKKKLQHVENENSWKSSVVNQYHFYFGQILIFLFSVSRCTIFHGVQKLFLTGKWEIIISHYRWSEDIFS